MSFLDNLENNLKSLESVEERDPNAGARREADRNRALSIAPWAEKLKSSLFTQNLLLHATQAGYKLRSKVYIAWLGTTLRLEMKERKLDLRPTPSGVEGVFIVDGVETRTLPVDLNGNPEDLIREWIE